MKAIRVMSRRMIAFLCFIWRICSLLQVSPFIFHSPIFSSTLRWQEPFLLVQTYRFLEVMCIYL